MSDYFTDETDSTDEQENGPAALRSALKAAQKAAKDAQKELADLRAESRTRTVADALKGAGVRPSIAKYIPADISDSDGVTAWLKENAEDFGITLGGEKAPEAQSRKQEQPTDSEAESSESAVPEQLRALYERMRGAEEQGESALPPEKITATLDALKNAGSFDAVQRILANA